MGQFTILVVSLLCLSAGLRAQSSATLEGRVLDPAGLGVPEAVVQLEDALTGFQRQVASRSDGSFSFTNVPFRDYSLSVYAQGFQPWAQSVPLRTNIPVQLDVMLNLEAVYGELTVVAGESSDLVDPVATGTRGSLHQSAIERMPVAVGSRGVEAALMSFPGFAANANGAIHSRGAHNQMTFVVDGMPISDQLTGAFATSLDEGMVQTLELFTGNVPAEYGGKISGVANITTRSGQGTGRVLGGSTTIAAGQFDTLMQTTQLAGESGRLGYFGSFQAMKSHRFLDQVALENMHNGGHSQRGFGRVDFQAGDRDWLRFQGMAGSSSFEIANLPSQHEAGQRQRQQLEDWSGWLGWVRSLSPASTLDATASYRVSESRFLPSPGDTPVTAAQQRQLRTLTLAGRYNRVQGLHTLRLGADWQQFPVKERFSFAVTAPEFNAPGSPDFIPTLLPFDLSRGGRWFNFNERGRGSLSSVFGQDTLRLGRWTLSLGLRFDDYRFLTKGQQWQPRLGAAFHLRETGTVLRVSYNRTYQTPPNENLLLANSGTAADLVPPGVREAVGGAFLAIRPERQNVYEAGIQQSLRGRMSLNVAYYHKNSVDMQDNDNFFNTGIIFPTSLAQSRVNGLEARLVAPEYKGFSGSLSATHARIVVTPPFTGGLFLGNRAVEALGSGPFIIDHDQALGLHGALHYNSRTGFWTSWSVHHDSGLVSNPSDPEEVAADPDYAPLLPYVNLHSDPPRVKPRTIAGFAAGYGRSAGDARRWEIVFSLSNITNRTALYNFQSIFVGTRLVQPRTAGLRVRFHF